MSTIGVMTMPSGFKYRDVFLKGKPMHGPADRFLLKHPAMDVGHRAKIFSPFDALKGFSEAITREGAEAVKAADAVVQRSLDGIEYYEDWDEVDPDVTEADVTE